MAALSLQTLALEDLAVAVGGLGPQVPVPPQQEDKRTWIQRLPRAQPTDPNMRTHVPPGMENIDKQFEKQPNPWPAPRSHDI